MMILLIRHGPLEFPRETIGLGFFYSLVRRREERRGPFESFSHWQW